MASSLSDALCGVLGVARRSANAFVVGPGFTVEWDLQRENSEVSAEFYIKKLRDYRIEILFSSTPGNTKDLFPFTGRGSRVVVPRGEADSDNPTVIIANTPEARRIRDERLATGEYVRTFARNCVMIPVHLKLEKLSRVGDPTVEVDRDFKTWGIVGSFPGFRRSPPGGLARNITRVGLRRGNYRLTARALAPTAVPDGRKTYLLLRYRVKY